MTMLLAWLLAALALLMLLPVLVLLAQVLLACLPMRSPPLAPGAWPLGGAGAGA